MSKPRESTIQVRVLEELKKYYANNNLKAESEFFCEKEKWTKKEYGRKRADGLICFEKNNQVYTVSLEAKSHRTLGALISSYNDEKFLIHSMIASGTLTMLLILGCIFYSELQWYFISLI